MAAVTTSAAGRAARSPSTCRTGRTSGGRSASRTGGWSSTTTMSLSGSPARERPTTAIPDTARCCGPASRAPAGGSAMPQPLSSPADLYARMRLIRGFESRALALVKSGDIAGGIHPYIGEEAVAVGVCAALRDDDQITSTHRGHGHVLAKGADPRRMLAELCGRETGLNHGRGGSMH